MKFPIATVTLVLAALLFVVWDQFREHPKPVDATRFANLEAEPAERSIVVDWVITEISSLCEEASGQPEGTDAHASCIKKSQARTSTCRRGIYDQFPSIVSSEPVFRDLSITMMNCLVPAL